MTAGGASKPGTTFSVACVCVCVCVCIVYSSLTWHEMVRNALSQTAPTALGMALTLREE